jgi:hypothetical protein
LPANPYRPSHPHFQDSRPHFQDSRPQETPMFGDEDTALLGGSISSPLPPQYGLPSSSCHCTGQSV